MHTYPFITLYMMWWVFWLFIIWSIPLLFIDWKKTYFLLNYRWNKNTPLFLLRCIPITSLEFIRSLYIAPFIQWLRQVGIGASLSLYSLWMMQFPPPPWLYNTSELCTGAALSTVVRWMKKTPFLCCSHDSSFIPVASMMWSLDIYSRH